MRERLVGMQEHVQDAEAVRTVTQVVSTQEFTERYFDGGEIFRHTSPAVCHCPRAVKDSARTERHKGSGNTSIRAEPRANCIFRVSHGALSYFKNAVT